MNCLLTTATIAALFSMAVVSNVSAGMVSTGSLQISSNSTTSTPTGPSTLEPSKSPSSSPSSSPNEVSNSTQAPLTSPTASPSSSPNEVINSTQAPSTSPTASPSSSPNEVSKSPLASPSSSPNEVINSTQEPSRYLSSSPTSSPNEAFKSPTTSPSNSPNENEVSDSSKAPSRSPTASPSSSPSESFQSPSFSPKRAPTQKPTSSPTAAKSSKLSKVTSSPTNQPTSERQAKSSKLAKVTSPPTNQPTYVPTSSPSKKPTLSPTPDVDEEVNAISFVMMGDIPYDEEEGYCLNMQLRNLNPSVIDPFKFIIHIGDIKPGYTQCRKSLYTDVAQIFTHPLNTLFYDPRDVFFLVGDNEWTDCEDPKVGMRHWMNTFGNGNKTHEGINTGPNPYGFGTFSNDEIRSTLVYDEQDNDGVSEDYPSSASNFAFYHNQTLFVGINQVGGGRVGDESIRVANNFVWVSNNMAKYASRGMRALVVFAHASMYGARYTYFGEPFMDLLLTDEYKDLLVLYAHGDGHDYFLEQDDSNSNLYRLQCDSGPKADPLSITIVRDGPSSTGTFSIKIDRRTVYDEELECVPDNTDWTWG